MEAVSYTHLDVYKRQHRETVSRLLDKENMIQYLSEQHEKQLKSLQDEHSTTKDNLIKKEEEHEKVASELEEKAKLLIELREKFEKDLSSLHAEQSDMHLKLKSKIEEHEKVAPVSYTHLDVYKRQHQ